MVNGTQFTIEKIFSCGARSRDSSISISLNRRPALNPRAAGPPIAKLDCDVKSDDGQKNQNIVFAQAALHSRLTPKIVPYITWNLLTQISCIIPLTMKIILGETPRRLH